MRKTITILLLISIMISITTSCASPGDESYSNLLPLLIVENDDYELSLIDVYKSDEAYAGDSSEEEMSEQCYIFKFKFHNKHENSNIRVALTKAAINGYSLAGVSSTHSDDSFSVYTWCGENADNTAVGCFKFYFSDIETATNIRDAESMSDATLSFIFRVFIIEEMDDYGEDSLITIENAFQYCS